MTIQQKTLEDLQAGMHFDIVIASHSVYSSCDGPVGDLHNRVDGIVRRIRALCASDGVTVTAVASANGLSYEFKRQALHRLFGGVVRDVVAEDFINVEAMR